MSNHSKVICIGLHKTGTTSLKSAMESVGLRVADWFGTSDPTIRNHALADAIEIMSQYDAAQDDPWYLLYKDLDEAYPGSKFILLTRDKDEWFESCLNYFGGTEINFVREWFYGEGNSIPSTENRSLWIRRHEEFESDVRDYFEGREENFLELALCSGEGWEKLGPFLGVESLSKKMPRVNASATAKYAKLYEDIYPEYLESRGVRKLYLRVIRFYLRCRINQ